MLNKGITIKARIGLTMAFLAALLLYHPAFSA